MEIILKEDIIGLGYKNDIVTVKDGYGRNFLIPTQKAVIASVSARKVLAENLKQQAHKLAAIKTAAEKQAEKFNGVELEIPVKVSHAGTIYGSVTTATVVEGLKNKGLEIDRKLITMKDIKKLGDFEAVVRFHKEVAVVIPVKVIDENPTSGQKQTETVEKKTVEGTPVETERDTEVE